MNQALLIDNSAWSRLGHASVPASRASELGDAMEQGQLIGSLPFLLEAGYSGPGGPAHARLQAELEAMPYVSIDDEVERRALDAQGALARSGHHRIPPVDLIIAALADAHGLGVLHYDGDFERILERTGLQFESVWLVARGSL